MHLRITLISAILLLLLAPGISAQQVSMEFYTTEDGLSSNRMRNTVCDPDGFVWAATDAPNRFNGDEFLNYNNRPEAVFQRFKNSGDMFIIDSCLYFWEGRGLIQASTETGQRRELALDSVLSPEAILNSGVIIQVSPDILLLFFLHIDHKTFDIVQFSDADFTNIGTIRDAILDVPYQRPIVFPSRDRYFMYVSEDGLNLVERDLQGKRRRVITMPEREGFVIVPGTTYETLLMQNDRVYYLNADDTEFQEHPVNRKLSFNQDEEFRRILEDEDGGLWLCGEFRNLCYYNRQTDILYNYHDQVCDVIPYQQGLLTIMPHPSGVLWISTSTGLLKVKPQRSWFESFRTGNQAECQGRCSFRGITEGDDGLVYASYYSNVFSINPGDNRISGPLAEEELTPFDLTYYTDRLVTNQGLVIDPHNGELSNPFKADVISADLGILMQDDKHRLFWGYGNKIYMLKASPSEAVEWEEVFETDVLINDMAYDATRNSIWLASLQKIARHEFIEGVFRPVNEVAFDPALGIRKMHCADNGVIWLATESGLLEFHPEDDYRKLYTTRDGLSNNLVVTLLPEGDSCLWLGTHSGLSRFSVQSQSFINFYTDDGLANNEFNRRSAFLSASGKMYFGGVGGLTAFYPSDVMQKYYEEPQPGQLVITSTSITDSRSDVAINSIFDQNDIVDIFPYNKSFRFEYFLTDYYHSDQVQYSYQLEGISDRWSAPSTESAATFNYLPAGNYTFKVRARTGQGQWLESQLTKTVVVHAPWYATWWAYSLYGLAVILFGLAIFAGLKKRWELSSDLKLKQAEADNLKKLDSFKSRLYTNLTHEFRTPLTVILGMARKLRDPEKVNIDDASKLIENNGQNLLQLVNQMLDLSKLENHAVKLQLQHKDIVSYLKFITQSFQSYANSRNVSMTFTSTVQLLEMDFDPNRLKQVLVNLISNALKFTTAGGSIVVQLDHNEESKSVAIKVRDDGMGISEHDLPFIFDRFYQANNNTTEMSVGTGIGLAHSRELVTLMDGEITVESEPGRGSVFSVSLPVQHTMHAMVAEDVTPIPDSGGLPVTNNTDLEQPAEEVVESDRPTVLVIEDNADVVFYLKSCIEHIYDVRIAYNGRIGIEIARSEIPDVIISDVMMPEADGYEVCDTLKNDLHTSHIPIILLTARVDAASKISGLQKGADAYLHKPFDQDELIAILDNMTAMRKRWVTWFTGSSDQEVPVEESGISSMDREFISRVRTIIEENYADEDFALPQLCQKVGMSRSQLFRKMKALLDVSPSHYLRKYRLEKAQKLLEEGELNVSQVAWQVGFKHVSHFSKSYQEEYGTTPSATHK